jgi:hypothetical protein
MAVYRFSNDAIEAVDRTTFSKLGITERDDLQRLLRDQVEIISPDTLVISEEFQDWSGSSRRIDLLGIDKDANIVVIELKRTEDGGHMDLQAIRYASMVSTLTFDQAVSCYEKYLLDRKQQINAESAILDFLGWSEAEKDNFGNDVRIVLASAEFSKELTTSVLWLRDRGELDIRCVRLEPFGTADEVLLHVQQVIPLPEAEDFQIRVRQKQEEQRESSGRRSNTTYRITVGDLVHERLPKRRAILTYVKTLVENGISPQAIDECINWRTVMYELPVAESHQSAIEMLAEQKKVATPNTVWFIKEEELVHFGDTNYVVVCGWSLRTDEALGILSKTFPHPNISYEVEK